MPLPQRIGVLLVAIALVLGAAYLVRERRLRRPFGLVWGGIGLMFLLFGLAPAIFEIVGDWFGLGREGLMAALCLLALVGVAGCGAVLVSQALDRQEKDAKELEALREELERLRGELKEARRPAPEQKPKPPALRT